MNFAQALRTENDWTRTTNGMVARSTSGNDLLNLFSLIGALRDAEESRIISLFDAAYADNKTYAMKMVFYARDIRGGLGERRVFRILIKHIANTYPDSMRKNIPYIGEYGRFDDLYELVGTPVEADMWRFMRYQLNRDIINCNKHKPISLLAKWIKSPSSKNKETRALGNLTARKLGYRPSELRKILRNLREYLRVTEMKMCANEWETITYSQVPSRAMNNYGEAFRRHDKYGFESFIEALKSGKEKINSSTLYPYDIIHNTRNGTKEEIELSELQWKALPNYVEKGQNVLIMADTSGSMWGRPMETSIGLALYFAERNTGAYHNMFMTFEAHPHIITLKDGMSFKEKVDKIYNAPWGNNTNIEMAFNKVLHIAKENHIPREQMVKSIIIISDMEFDYCAARDMRKDFHTIMSKRFKEAGYEMPNVVFWNVRSTHDLFHASSTREGVQLVSGQSSSTFKNLVGTIGYSPLEFMYQVLDSERYECICA